MATGTGKTITSLSCAVKLFKKVKQLITIIAVPFDHLVDQWKEDVINFGFNPILCRGSYRNWLGKLQSKLRDYEMGFRNSLCIIVTHKTAASDRFIKLVNDCKEDILFIGDEMHYLGAENLRKSLRQNYNYRLGLSATPDRWFDEEGTEYIKEYFGQIAKRYSLREAINNGFLTPYQYIPHIVELNDNELEEYNELTHKIVKVRNSVNDEDNEVLTRLLVKRADIIAKAKNKKRVLKELLEKQILNKGKESLSHTIVYCGRGEHKEVLKLLSNLGIQAHEFVHTVPTKERQRILDYFDEGDIQILVAMKCLDEGVNIPATKEAFFLASTSNPREFVQRRGRILRRYSGKHEALVHDFIVLPQTDKLDHLSEDMLKDYKSIVKKEMPRFAEFSLEAKNTFQARDKIYSILKRLNLLHLFDKKPWEVYEEYDL